MTTLLNILEVLDGLNNLVHRQRLAIAQRRTTLAEMMAEASVREAQTALAIEGKNDTERQARLTLTLAADADYQHLQARIRELRQEIAERAADIEQARVRIRISLFALPIAGAVDALSPTPDSPDSPVGAETEDGGAEDETETEDEAEDETEDEEEKE